MTNTVADFDTRIAQLVVELSDLRAQRNQAAAALLRVPNEILLNILLAVQSWYIRDRNALRRWVHIMGVSRRFRNLALQSPALWSRFKLRQETKGSDVYTAEWVRLCNQRGAHHPAVLSLNVSKRRVDKKHRELYDGIVGLAPRTQTLDIMSAHHIKAKELTFYRELLAQTWPMLQTLFITGSSDDEERQIGLKLLSGSYPILTTVHFRVAQRQQLKTSAWIYHELPDLPCLQVLTINSLDLNGKATQFYQDLSRLSSLASLNLLFIPECPVALAGAGKEQLKNTQSMLHLCHVELRGNENAVYGTLRILPNPKDSLTVYPSRTHTTSKTACRKNGISTISILGI